ncbi:DNA polymerase iota-like isoform X2 [Patiria miniata]|uniref:UmuC domain-containing protein n=1 Tax=Patiria miniata TaxID=46514 RepID=A0A914BCC1_PATMI|nr:DNA polymerase iota-like isoform X2 [Patiria miniata]
MRAPLINCCSVRVLQYFLLRDNKKPPKVSQKKTFIMMDEVEDEDWSKPTYSDDSFRTSNPSGQHAVASSSGSLDLKVMSHTRTIIHIDLDCYYAQVEMVRNPALRTKPLGIQQKYLLVTCNYVARARGVTKLMRITDALQRCPDLVIVNGEDLTHYREMSYRITELLQQFSPLVERLGFDENFIDVSHLVSQRLQREEGRTEVFGHVYGETATNSETNSPPICTCGCHQRLLLASHIAHEMREALWTQLGLTSCAGVAHNKLLAKLVGSTHKPNDQTTLYPHMLGSLMASLTKVTQVPGIGHSTGKKLSSMGITTLDQLIEAPLSVLKEEFGYQTACTMQKLCQGHDESPVVQSGPPQSISDEDSFRKCSSLQEAQVKMKALLCSLLQRLRKDGRQPHTLRLSVRKYSRVHKWTRESRQCGMPDGILHSLQSDEDGTASKLLDLCVGLFHKMVDTSQPFHLTLISVCFAKFQSQSRTTSDITKFFSPRSVKKGCYGDTSNNDNFTVTEESYIEKSEACSLTATDVPSAFVREDGNLHNLSESVIPSSSNVKLENKLHQSGCSDNDRLLPSQASSCSATKGGSNNKIGGIRNSNRETNQCTVTMSGHPSSLTKTENEQAVSDASISPHKRQSFFAQKSETATSSQIRGTVDRNTRASDRDCRQTAYSTSSGHQKVSFDSASSKKTANDEQFALTSEHADIAPAVVPPNVDPLVFAELPSELQQELTNEWRNMRHDNSKPRSTCTCTSQASSDSQHIELTGIDQSVFEELPPDIQREVLEQQKQKKRTLTSHSPQSERTLHAKRPRTVKTSPNKAAGKSTTIKDFFTRK